MFPSNNPSGISRNLDLSRNVGSGSGPPPPPVSAKIDDALNALLNSYKARNLKTANVKELLGEINTLIGTIGDVINRASGKQREKILDQLKPIIDELNTNSGQADSDADELETTLIILKKALEKALDPVLQEVDDQGGGFKHSRRNSRKYMMKRVYSNRSLVRKRRSRTKRRKNNKKK